MERKLISIIIPVYNAEKTIEKCIKSLIKQTYLNIEIIVVDDGSTDNSLSICKSLASNEKRLRIYHKKNSGVSNTRNYGLKKANGDFIGFVDADDYVESNMYELLYGQAIKNDCQIVGCNLFFESDIGKETMKFDYPDKHFNSIEFPIEMFNNLAFNGYLCNKLYAKELIFSNNNVLLNEKINILEDNLFNYEIFENNNNFKCSYINDKLYHYVQFKNSASNKKYDIKRLQYFYVRDKQIKILDKKEIDSNFLKIDYIINFKKEIYKIKKLKITKTNDFYNIQKNYENYKKNVHLSNVNNRLLFKYILSTYFPFILYMYINFKNENL